VNATGKELHPLELASKVTTEFAYNGTFRGMAGLSKSEARLEALLPFSGVCRNS